jgi:phosphoglycolate phosphatase
MATDAGGGVNGLRPKDQLYMRIGNLIFDLDGTLVDTRPGIEGSVRAAIDAVVPRRACPDLRPYIGPPVRRIFTQILGDPSESVLDQLVKEFRISYDSDGWKRSEAYPGAAEALRGLREMGVRCFVATNKPYHASRRILEHMGLYGYFQDVVSPDSRIPSFSSKAEIVAHLVGKHGLQTDDTMLVGDCSDDYTASHANGIYFAAAIYGYGDLHAEVEQVDCRMVVSGLLELIDAGHPRRPFPGRRHEEKDPHSEYVHGGTNDRQ